MKVGNGVFSGRILFTFAPKFHACSSKREKGAPASGPQTFPYLWTRLDFQGLQRVGARFAPQVKFMIGGVGDPRRNSHIPSAINADATHVTIVGPDLPPDF